MRIDENNEGATIGCPAAFALIALLFGEPLYTKHAEYIHRLDYSARPDRWVECAERLYDRGPSVCRASSCE